MGDIHSKKRNRLHPDKVRDIAVVKLDIQREHAELRKIHPRPKRQFMRPIDTGRSDASTSRATNTQMDHNKDRADITDDS